MEPDVDAIGTLIAFVLTLMVYCYLGKDIPFLYFIYRVAAAVFVGVALGYGAAVAWHNVLVPRLWLRLAGGQWWYIVPLVLCLLLLIRIRRAWAVPARITLAFVLGVGAALAVGGAVVGTLVPQIEATFVSLNPGHYQALADSEGNSPWIYVLNALLVAGGTVSTLMYFYFAAERRPFAEGAPAGRLRALAAQFRHQALRLSAGFGQVFLMFTFGALFATTAISRFSLLADRIRFIIETIWSYMPVP